MDKSNTASSNKKSQKSRPYQDLDAATDQNVKLDYAFRQHGNSSAIPDSRSMNASRSTPVASSPGVKAGAMHMAGQRAPNAVTLGSPLTHPGQQSLPQKTGLTAEQPITHTFKSVQRQLRETATVNPNLQAIPQAATPGRSAEPTVDFQTARPQRAAKLNALAKLCRSATPTPGSAQQADPFMQLQTSGKAEAIVTPHPEFNLPAGTRVRIKAEIIHTDDDLHVHHD